MNIQPLDSSYFDNGYRLALHPQTHILTYLATVASASKQLTITYEKLNKELALIITVQS